MNVSFYSDLFFFSKKKINVFERLIKLGTRVKLG